MVTTPNVHASTAKEAPMIDIDQYPSMFDLHSRRVRLGFYLFYLTFAGIVVALLSAIPGIPHELNYTGLSMIMVFGSAGAIILGYPLWRGGFGPE